MLPSPPPERIALPAPVAPGARPPFPWIATVAPVVVSGVLWAVTGSALSLAFAALGPVVALGGVVDAARSRRGTARREEQRLQVATARVEGRIREAHERERLRRASVAGGSVVRFGTGDVAGVVELTGDDDSPLHALATSVPAAPLLLDASGGVGVVGPPALARAVARSIAVQLSPAETWHEPPDLEVFRRDGVTVAWAATAAELPSDCAEVIEVAPGIHAITREQAVAASRSAADETAGLPEHVEFEGLPAPQGSAGGLRASIGRDDAGAVALDLVTDGPHALVAGTTGSGKSELLVTWVLGMADGRTPEQVTFVLIDFKGGAAFAPLAGLPHVLATLSDLDPALTRRAVASLRAELLRRERLLATHRARAIDELPAGVLARLVIVVDEFAAVVAAGPELQEVFADLAARGRSLGMHLVLCTQRPAGVVRDAVLANVGLRISLRVADRADSIAMLGDDAAARLPASPRGRAVLATPGGPRIVQVALASPADAERVAAGADPARHPAPWCPPLPPMIELDDLPATTGGLAFGRVDRVAEQLQPVAVHEPRRHGHLLVLGSAGAGATTVAATLAESARRGGMAVDVLSDEPADAWAQLQRAGDGERLLIADGLDALLGRFDPDYRSEFLDLLTRVLRDPSPGAARAIVTARRLTGQLNGLTGLFGSRLLLRQASRDDHVLAGGGHGDWDPELRPGAGSWRGSSVQVARVAGGSLPPPRVPPPVSVRLASHPVLAVVAARPRTLLDPLRTAGARVVQLGRDAAPDADALRVSTGAEPTVLLGDPDAWLADWTLLATARREWPIVLSGCAPADHRALLRSRELPPPLGPGPAECWLVREGDTARARLQVSSAPDSEAERPENR